MIARGYETVVNVGCAEGYYAVGLARRMPTAHVHAFELVDETRRTCELTARLNGVEGRVSVSGAAGAGDVAPALRGRRLVICDCEGARLGATVVTHNVADFRRLGRHIRVRVAAPFPRSRSFPRI